MNLTQKTITILLLSIFFVGCKKGEEDPTISFRTRKARLTGRWQIKSGTSRYTEQDINGFIYSESYTFDESKFRYSDNPYYYYAGGHSLTMNFEKNGTLTYTESFDGVSSNFKGTWDFNTGVGEKKNKEEIIIHITSIENPQGQHIVSGNYTDITYNILELRNNKMKLVASQKIVKPDGTSKSYEDRYEMKQK